MSTACGRPQGGGGPAHVDACGRMWTEGWGQNLIFCGRHKWMAPKENSQFHCILVHATVLQHSESIQKFQQDVQFRHLRATNRRKLKQTEAETERDTGTERQRDKQRKKQS